MDKKETILETMCFYQQFKKEPCHVDVLADGKVLEAEK